ncbi:hypothetical protein [Candidatus Magnetaquicoccus inordinatus]|uniref:hypothetical protein n=1 Tax=Candidatus Magnetaquicoccus inordinatus TaxID=2496818 RepID=UPI00102B05A1|nr:hypothetical protein [Candidatus Magnetaquicoccus inordinatus]
MCIFEKYNFVSFGIYEVSGVDFFPSHVPPIIGDLVGNKIRRWKYEIRHPYEIVPVSPVGAYKKVVNCFPQQFFIHFTPRKITKKTQTIALGCDCILVSHHKLYLLVSIIVFSIIMIRSKRQFINCFVTIKNILS